MVAATLSPDELSDDAELWRRIPLRPPWYIFDSNDGRVRPSSGAFKDNRKGPVSAYIAARCGGEAVLLAGHEDFRLVSFTAGLVRDCGLEIILDEEHGGLGHVLLVGDKEQRRLNFGNERMAAKEALARMSRWLGEPPPAPQT